VAIFTYGCIDQGVSIDFNFFTNALRSLWIAVISYAMSYSRVLVSAAGHDTYTQTCLFIDLSICSQRVPVQQNHGHGLRLESLISGSCLGPQEQVSDLKLKSQVSGSTLKSRAQIPGLRQVSGFRCQSIPMRLLAPGIRHEVLDIRHDELGPAACRTTKDFQHIDIQHKVDEIRMSMRCCSSSHSII